MEAKVVKIVDKFKVAVNKGSVDGISKDDIFMIFEQGEELFDPDSKESLGFLEIPKLKMKVYNIQDKITLLESFETKTETDRNIRRTIKKNTTTKNIDYEYDLFESSMSSMLVKDFLDRNKNNEEIETIIEEKPITINISVNERGIQEGNIARKI